MNPKSTLFLLLIVLTLGGAIWWQTNYEKSGALDLVLPLFEGVDRDRVVSLRVDHIERGVNVKLERDGRRAWFLTDPVEYRAEEAVVKLMLDAVTRNQMVVVSEEESALASPSFDPPRVVFEVGELFDDGRRRSQLVEIGQQDIDGQHVFVRRDGRLFKTAMNLDTTLTRHSDDYRSRRALTFQPRAVRELRRKGTLVEGNTALDMDLVLAKSGIEWRMQEPYQVAADALVVENYILALANLRIERFVSEGQHPLERYGLHQPDFSLELTGAEGALVSLYFGQPSQGGNWYAKQADMDTVWLIKEDQAYRAALASSNMFQLELLSIVRDRVERVELQGGPAPLRLDRVEQGWTVSQQRDGSWGLPLPADRERADAVLADLEKARVTRYLLDVDAETALEGSGRSVAIVMQGQSFRVHMGGLYRSEEGSEALRARRDGDRLVALVPATLGALFELSRQDLQSLAIHSLDEARLVGLELEAGGVTRTFRRSRKAVWSYPDMDAEAVELRPVLDKIFFLRAEQHLDSASGLLKPLRDPVEILIRSRAGDQHLAVLGLGEDDRVAIDHQGTRSIAAYPELHGQLLEIVAKKPGSQEQ